MSSFSRKDRQGLAILALVGVALVGLVTFFVVATDKPALDERLCPPIVSSKTAFLVDLSDDTPTQTVDEIRKRIIKIIDQQVEENELVSIFYITNDIETKMRPVFESCKPKSKGNALYEGTRTIERKFADQFRKPLETVLAQKPSGSEISPIAEALTDFTVSDYLDGNRNRLVIFSDLMQNSGSLRLYECQGKVWAIDIYRQRRAGAVQRPELKNVEVSLNIVPRQGLGSDVVECRDAFWAWFFGNNSGDVASVTTSYLPGGATVE